MRSRIFIGSSTEGVTVAEFAQAELTNDSQPELWSNGIFKTINVPLESLMNAVEQYDFALFVLVPEDSVNIRGVQKLVIRDNVLFELGLFLGKLGRSKIFFIAPRGDPTKTVHFPSDLTGITPAWYDAHAANLQAAIGTALREFKQTIRDYRNFVGQAILDQHNFKEYHFEHKGGHDIWKNGTWQGEKGKGHLSFPEPTVFQIEKSNAEGRYEVEYRPFGPTDPTLRKIAHPERVFKVSFRARVDDGSSELRFVLKDLEKNAWASDRTVFVNSREYQDYEFYLRASPFADLLFRIDLRKASKVPIRVFVDSLRVIEVK